MNILIFSDSAWDDTNSLGNTMSNFFDGDVWNNSTFSNIYLRNAQPNNKVCKRYYRMTVFDMLKHHFNKEKIGAEFKYEYSNKEDVKSIKARNEQKYINFLHKHSLKVIYCIIDFFFRKKRWINKKFEKFVNEIKPDIVFSFLNTVSMLNPFVEYIKKNTNSKVVTFIADDVYGAYNNKPILLRKKYLNEMKNIINNSDKIYAISAELCETYSKIYNKNITILYKGCTIDLPLKRKINEKIKFVYAGNLLYGRDEILSKIAKAIEKYNKIGQSAILEIYTNTPITSELEQKLNVDGSSIIMGKRSYEEIKKIMNDAEYNLHVESFEKNNIEKVKYSFSTKIIDCLQSGSSFIGIGPSSISSIKYINKIPGAYVIDSINNIEDEIVKLIKKKGEILTNAKKIREYATEFHDNCKNQMKLKKEFEKLLEN